MVTAGPNRAFTVLEGVRGATAAAAGEIVNCGALPTRGCTNNNWGNLGGGAVIGTARDIGGIAANTTDYTTAVTIDGVAQSTVNICFSPGGRTFVNNSSIWAEANWTPLTSVVVTWAQTSVPSGTVHQLHNVSDAPATVLWSTRPALRTGEFFLAMHEARGDLDRLVAVIAEYDDVFCLAEHPL